MLLSPQSPEPSRRLSTVQEAATDGLDASQEFELQQLAPCYGDGLGILGQMAAPKELPNPVQSRTRTSAMAAASSAVFEINGITPAAHASSTTTTTPATTIVNAGDGTVDREGWGRGAVAGRARLEEIRQVGALLTPSPMDESQSAAGAGPLERRRSNASDTGSTAAVGAPPPARPRWSMTRRSASVQSSKERRRPREGALISRSISTVSRGGSRVVSTMSNKFDRIKMTGKSRHKTSEEERRNLGSFPAGFPLNKRRATELALIKKFDRLTINPNVGEYWFVIDSRWINSWVEFVMGQASAPGAISNLNLYRQDGDGDMSTSAKSPSRAPAFGVEVPSLALDSDSRFIKGLRITKDYRIIHPLVWFIFQELYGTDEAPDICRWNADIYSEPVKLARKMKVVQTNKTKATYTVSRIIQKAKDETEKAEQAAAQAAEISSSSDSE